jgi:hypothetical protein
VATASGKEKRKGWPVWPALSLEHFRIVAADEAKEKGEKDTVRARPSRVHFACS